MSNTGTYTSTVTTPQASASFLGSPDDVLRNAQLTLADKRSILARWASDAHAVVNAPALRRLDDGSVVTVDDILAALKALDGHDESAAAARPIWRAYDRKRASLLSRVRAVRRRNDHDDDPPPCPASAAFAVRVVLADAVAA